MLRSMLASGLSFLLLTVTIMLLDRLSKAWAVAHLTLFEPMTVLPVFNLTLAYNRGAAFSFFHHASGWQNIAFGAFAMLVSVGILIWLSRLKRGEYWLNVALCLVLGGALGNAWDRVCDGYVTDFLHFHWKDWHFAIFNIADSAICIGAIMMSMAWWFTKGDHKS